MTDTVPADLVREYLDAEHEYRNVESTAEGRECMKRAREKLEAALPAPLAPCPFCSASTSVSVAEDQGLMYVECGRCYARGPARGTYRVAKAAWNARGR